MIHKTLGEKKFVALKERTKREERKPETTTKRNVFRFKWRWFPWCNREMFRVGLKRLGKFYEGFAVDLRT